MESLVVLITCLALGVTVARIGQPPPALAPGLNWWVLNIALPALVLSIVPRLTLSVDLWYPVAAMWAVFLGGWGFFTLLGRALRWPARRIGALTLVSGLGNTAFIGYPLIEALRGPAALPVAAIADQAGVFLALAVGGTFVAAFYAHGRVTPAMLARKVLLFPAFLALVAGLLIGRLGGLPPLAESVAARIGSTLVPLALFSVGLQLRIRLPGALWPAVAAGLCWKLVLAPAMTWAFALLFDIAPGIASITVLQAAMAPMITAAILAQQHDLEPELSGVTLGLGILLSFLTVPLVSALV